MKNNNIILPEHADYPIYSEPKASKLKPLYDYGYNYEEGYTDDNTVEIDETRKGKEE